MALPVHLTTTEPAEVVLSFDESVRAAWSPDDCARYLHRGETPKGSKAPAGATRFRIRPMGWAERRAARDASANGLYSARGNDLLEQYIAAIIAGRKRAADADADEATQERAGRDAGDVFRRALDLADRAELDRASVLNLTHDEALVGACCTAVIDGDRKESWRTFADQVDAALMAQVITELARHIRRISTVSTRQGF